MLFNPKSVNFTALFNIPEVTSADAYWCSVGGLPRFKEALERATIASVIDGAVFTAFMINEKQMQFHGVIWSADALRNRKQIVKDMRFIWDLYPAVQEVIVVVPLRRHGLKSFLRSLGFQFRATFKNVYTDAEGCQDGAQYSILRKDIGGHHG